MASTRIALYGNYASEDKTLSCLKNPKTFEKIITLKETAEEKYHVILYLNNFLPNSILYTL